MSQRRGRIRNLTLVLKVAVMSFTQPRPSGGVGNQIGAGCKLGLSHPIPDKPQ